ncbi:hypothetical protein MLD38_036385 [Melastoma candidum]|uniref:Uncharacterized protein n=1 Tax=Melastoma candidum TaxID=119954 RepID=A0ACB9LLD9_9MYRT|nr:hypothetical protein MLD38_036385 [Melastoma candidum]
MRKEKKNVSDKGCSPLELGGPERRLLTTPCSPRIIPGTVAEKRKEHAGALSGSSSLLCGHNRCLRCAHQGKLKSSWPPALSSSAVVVEFELVGGFQARVPSYLGEEAAGG